MSKPLIISDVVIKLLFPWIYEKKRLLKIAKQFGLKFKVTEDMHIAPPLIDTKQKKRYAEQYLVVDENRKIYRMNSAYNGDIANGMPRKYWVYYMEFPSELPYFVVDSIFNRVTIEKGFKAYQEIKLEGEFADAYTVYAPTKEQVQVLSVLGPDLMEAIISHWEHVGLIVAGKKAWIIMRYDDSDEMVSLILEVGESIYRNLLHSAKSHRYVTSDTN